MNHLPTSILNLLGFTTKSKKEVEDDEGGDMTSMVQKLVMDQHRTMFYTVTLSPVSQPKNPEHNKVIAPSLKVNKKSK